MLRRFKKFRILLAVQFILGSVFPNAFYGVQFQEHLNSQTVQPVPAAAPALSNSAIQLQSLTLAEPGIVPVDAAVAAGLSANLLANPVATQIQTNLPSIEAQAKPGIWEQFKTFGQKLTAGPSQSYAVTDQKLRTLTDGQKLASEISAAPAVVGVTEAKSAAQLSAPAPAPILDRPAPASPDQGKLGVDLTAMDTSVRPQDDFFRYVNGTWLKNFQIPADKTRYGVFDSLAEKSQVALKEIIENPANEKANEGTFERKISDVYKSFLDTDAITARGLKPIEKDLAKLKLILTKDLLGKAFALAPREGAPTPIGLYVGPDSKNPTKNIVTLTQSGLGLPGRDFYLKTDENFAVIRKKYVDYITTVLRLVGESSPETKAQAIYSLEKSLAEVSWDKEDRRDPIKTYSKMTVKDLSALAPGFDWEEYLRLAEIPASEKELVVSEPSFFTGFAKLFAEQPLDTWKLYLKFHALRAASPYLPSEFEKASFEFYGRTLSGQQEMTPRWKRAVNAVNGALGEAIGKLYVEKHFPESSKTRMVTLVENLRGAYGERIKGLHWMGEETKKKALEKLSKFLPNIGYPDKWRDYSGLATDPSDLIGNIRRSDRFDYDYMVSKLGKPVDRREWGMTPQTVNAEYHPDLNSITFPAAILQGDFFNPEADDAVNYGAIGGVIGHEMGHGYDDQGAKFDGDGRLNNWWTQADEKAFRERTQKLVGQYAAFEPLPGLHINGNLTLGENIGDLGGLTVALAAYKRSLNGKPSPVIGGFTGEQRVFLGWAQVWRQKMRDEALRLQVLTNEHSPAEYRVNGVVRNMPEFYQAFGVKEGDKLHLDEKDRVSIW